MTLCYASVLTGKGKFALFSDHNGSLLWRQPKFWQLILHWCDNVFGTQLDPLMDASCVSPKWHIICMKQVHAAENQ